MGSAVALEDRHREIEVVAKATRRRFTAEYKLKVLREADSCTKPGEIGVLLRREGLYTSHLCIWRKQRRAGEFTGLSPARRGPAPKEKNPLAAKVAALEKATRERYSLVGNGGYRLPRQGRGRLSPPVDPDPGTGQGVSSG